MWRLPALVALCFLTFFLGVGDPAIADTDEAFYAESAREMVESGDWVTPHYNYEPRLQKPILYYWLAASAFSVAGVGEAQARFFAALSGLGLAWVAFACGRRWYGEETGLLAGAVVATSLGAFALARQSLPDVPTAFFISLATWAGIEATRASATGGGARAATGPGLSRRAFLLVSAAALGLGMLAKGPIALALPIAVVVPLMAGERWRAARRRTQYEFPLKLADLAIGAGLFMIVAAPWYLAITWTRGPGYLYQFFVGENLQRFATPAYNEPRAIWYYVPILLGGLLPWSPVLLLWLPAVWKSLRRIRAVSSTELRLSAWTLVPLALLSVSVGKQPRYILPCLVPVAVLIGRTLVACSRDSAPGGRRAALRTAGGAIGAIVAAAGLLMWRAGPLFASVSSHWSRLVPATILAAGLFAMVESFFGSARRIPLVLVAASAIMLATVQHAVLGVGRPEAVERIAAAAKARDAGATVCACGAFTRNLGFYTRSQTAFGGTEDEVRRVLASDRRMLAVVDAEVLARLESGGTRYRRVADARYLNTGQLRIGTFLYPSPARDLQRVVLVSNR